MNDFNKFCCRELTNLKFSQIYMSQMLGVVIQNNYRLSAALEASNQALYMQKTQFPRTLEQDLSSGHYYSRERNGRIIPIGIIKIKEVITINPQDNDTFEFIYVEYSTCETETYSATIPYNDFVAKRILQHLYKFQKHIDCPDKILRDVFYSLIMNSANQKALTIPERIGWVLTDADTGHYITGNNYDQIAYINCIPEYILNHRINPTTRTSKEVLNDYLRLAPQNWKTTFLLGFGKVMNNAETLIFLKPTTDSEKDVAAVLGFKKNEINKFHTMNRGDCIISGKFYSKKLGCNRPAVLSGKVYSNR